MKKAVSILLAVLTLFMVAAPLALAEINEFQAALEDARNILHQSERYRDAFIEELRAEVFLAEMYGEAYPEENLAKLKALVKDAPNQMKLSSWEWLNNSYSNNCIRAIWRIVDFFNSISNIWGLFTPALYAIGRLLGFILNPFAWFA